ncbi:hypothetical protein C8R46DRAFT_1342887 [Mycena filopes]|nr:hypothetical protein C8R46DRAFT_1342887 [Mycena filopes]
MKVAVLPLFFSSTLASLIVDTLIVDDNGGLIEKLGTFPTTSFHWPVDLKAGTVVAAQLSDSKGTTATGNLFTIQPGANDCTLRNDNVNAFVTSPPPSTTTETTIFTSTAVQTVTQPPSPPSSASVISPTVVGGIATSASVSSASSQSPSQPSSTQAPKPSETVAQPVESAVASSTLLPESPPSAVASSSKSTSHTPLILGILLPILILLGLLALWLTCRRRRRRRSSASDLEARPLPLPRRWFDKPIYRVSTTSVVNPIPTRRASLQEETIANPAETVGAGAARPALNINTALGAPTESDKDVEALRSRIQTLMAENAALADLVTPQGDMPPPAYDRRSAIPFGALNLTAAG